MSRFHHGSLLVEEDAPAEPAVINPTASVSAAAQPAIEQTRFGFLFPQLQNDAHLLTKSDETVNNLIALGKAMDDTAGENAFNSKLPAVFTYFGQFIAHDITWEKGTKDIISVPEIQPWEPAQVQAIVNKRSGSLDLDSIYGDATFKVPREEDGKLTIGFVASSKPRPSNKADRNDVPRTKHSDIPDQDRVAIIGDPRNDENVIISQLHVAFLHAHNKLMESHSFEEARTALVQLYQTIVVDDYLARIILPDVLAQVRQQPDLYYKQSCMPVEFSAAAFRFGHTMIRTAYDLNRNFKGKGSKIGLARLFDIPPAKYHNLPESWIIEWEFFIDGGSNVARQISTQLVEPLSLLKETPNNPFKNQSRLAVRDLLRGYIFRLPTGQSVADEMGVEKVTADDFHRLVPASQWEVLSNSELLEKTPLWFYLLAEAAREKERNSENDYLGPVGSRIVAGVLMGLLLRSKDSILQNENVAGATLKDLFRLAGVLSNA